MAVKYIAINSKLVLKSVRHILKPFRITYQAKTSMATTTTEDDMLNMVKKIVPTMTASHHKGQSGRIAIIGGCKEYTGAPYFAGISALKVGADLAHIFCTAEAGPVIKSYSPDLIVHPILDAENAVKEISQWLPRMHVIVIGPGLGRTENVFENVKEVIYKAKEANMPLVIDADGLFLVTQSPEIVHGYNRTILTPNKIELVRLYEKVIAKSTGTLLPSDVEQLATQLGGVTIVGKGAVDIITNGQSTVLCKTQGSNRRCGGQGDLLSGSLGTFAHWGYSAVAPVKNEMLKTGAPVLAGYGACFLTRQCNKMAYESHKRAMVTSDMIACIGKVFNTYLEVDN